MVAHVFRGIQKLSQVLNSGTKTLNFTLRHASTSIQSKFMTGPNGEKFIPSPFGVDISYQEMLIHDFVWRNSENYSNKIALECGITGKKYTYSQAKDATNYIGRSLRHIGLKKGDVVALIAPNLPDSILAFLGITSGGLVVTTMNPQYTVDEISRQLLISNAKAVITAADIAPVMLAATKASLPPGTPFIVIDDETRPIPEGSILFDDLITRGKSLTLTSDTVSFDDIVVLPFSSGTTGLPKAVMLTHCNLVSNIHMVERSLSPDLIRPTTDTYQEIIPTVLPFFHIYGMNAVILPRLATGGKIITIPKFVPKTFVNVLEKNKATLLFCVPPMVLFLTSSPLVKRHQLEHIHMAMSGAAPIAKSDIDKLYDKFNINPNSLKFCQGYGLTESSPVAFVEITGKKYSSIGKNVGGCEARLVDITTNQDISNPGQTGELWIRGPHIMKGYLNNEAATKEILTEDKWLKTGDIAYFDEEFDFYITDRLKELIKVKGFQVPPAELEALLRTHPNVEEAAVIGIPHPKCGEVPKAFVVMKKGKESIEDDIKNFLKGKVADFKQLEGGVTFVKEIPKNASGKILRSKLKSAYIS